MQAYEIEISHNHNAEDEWTTHRGSDQKNSPAVYLGRVQSHGLIPDNPRE